jgi:hypothetical protein
MWTSSLVPHPIASDRSLFFIDASRERRNAFSDEVELGPLTRAGLSSDVHNDAEREALDFLRAASGSKGARLPRSAMGLHNYQPIGGGNQHPFMCPLEAAADDRRADEQSWSGNTAPAEL